MPAAQTQQQQVIRASTRTAGCCEEDTLHLAHPELPSWPADPFIQGGYRRVGQGCLATARSVCSCHNETVNIWTHGIGAVFFLVALICIALTGNLGAASSLAHPWLASPPGHASYDLLASAAWALKRATGISALGGAGVAAAPCGDQWRWVAAGRHTSLLLSTEGLLRPDSNVLEWNSTCATCRWSCASDAASVCTEQPNALDELFAGAQHRVTGVVQEVQKLGSALDLQALVERVKSLGDAGEASLESWVAGAGALEEEAVRALGGLLSGAGALEEEVSARIAAITMLASRELGVDKQHDQLTRHKRSVSEREGSTKDLQGADMEEEEEEEGDGSARLAGLLLRRRVRTWPVVVFASSALICLALSVVFHLFWVVGERASKLLARLDYSGIALLIAGSTCPVIEYGLECDGALRVGSLVFMYTLCLLAVSMGLLQRFQTEAWRPARAMVFVGTGLGGMVPIATFYWLHGDEPVVAQACFQIIIMGVMYVLGAALYASRVPERCFPGKLDLLGASHQLFHALVFAAALLHYHTVLLLYRWRTMQPHC